MILFLNKCDILKRKLRSGIMVRDFLPSYGERPNDAPTVLKCKSLILIMSDCGILNRC